MLSSGKAFHCWSPAVVCRAQRVALEVACRLGLWVTALACHLAKSATLISSKFSCVFIFFFVCRGRREWLRGSDLVLTDGAILLCVDKTWPSP
jgi:hypothetical protein